MRFRPNFAFSRFVRRRSGYTLVEILVALTLTMVLMTAVVTVFGGVGDGIAKSRRAMEQFDRLRTVAQQCDQDLKGITVTLDGRPTRPEENRGYLELIAASILPTPQAYNGATNTTDFTVGAGTADASHVRSDILMFTTRNATRPFLGRYALMPTRRIRRCSPTWPRSPGSSAARICTGEFCWCAGRRSEPVIRQPSQEHILRQQRYLRPLGERPDRSQ